MNTSKIKFEASNVTKEIEVKGAFQYLINPQIGKKVLRITASEDDTTFDDLKSLESNDSGIIEYYEREIIAEDTPGEWVLKNTYEDYNSGDVDISYQNGQYQCDVTKVDGVVKALEQQRADIDYIAIMADIPLDGE